MTLNSAGVFVIGLTGGTGSGKTTAAAVMAREGAVILDCDEIAHEILTPGYAAYKDAVEVFGAGIVRADGTIDRRRLGAIIFAEPGMRARLMELTFKHIIKEVLSRLESLRRQALADRRGRAAVIDAPLLIEAGLHKAADEVWLLRAAESLRVTRAARRDNLDPESVLLRARSQLPFDQLKKHAHVIIENEGSLADLEEKVTKLFCVSIHNRVGP
ncbi:MAG: dephospho-CoA kinase [Clostridiales bacterium]|jgi:dephospho-CoA kinase|nr:dephospho-CoA kinase [Clostridiales bacterium]